MAHDIDPKALRPHAKVRTVGDIMSRVVVTVRVDETRAHVIDALKRHRIGAVPVADSGGHVVGVISKGDLVSREGNIARDLMTPVVHTVRPDFPAIPAARRMLGLGLHRLLVVDAGAPVGVVTAIDFLRELLDHEDTPVR